MDVSTLFNKLGGSHTGVFPHVDSPLLHTQRGTRYLCHPGVVMLSKPHVGLGGLSRFFEEFGEDLQFSDYLNDPVDLTPAAALIKTAGQSCYASFGPRRTSNKDAKAYFDKLSSSGHGSVFEHAVFSFLIYGISRSNTHEIVRHRAGTAFSQLSQRFVSGNVLRFVERPEYQDVPALHERFEQRIDEAAREYEQVTEELLRLQSQGYQRLSAEARTDLRKRVQQVARSVLPNETETILVLSANVRAWRHMIEMRTDLHAESEIRDLYFRIFLCLCLEEPLLFGDYEITSHPDGSFGVHTEWRKV